MRSSRLRRIVLVLWSLVGIVGTLLVTQFLLATALILHILAHSH